MILDCNLCPKVSVTEDMQNEIRKAKGHFPEHWCLRYDVPLFHYHLRKAFDPRNGHDPALQPCWACLRDAVRKLTGKRAKTHRKESDEKL